MTQTREATSKPVWVWLPDSTVPVRCGTFTWRAGAGEFVYDPAYPALGNAFPLDPVQLPFLRASRVFRETRQDGLFGVLRDASPEGYGLALLETLHGRELSPLDRLELALGDGVGAVEVCDDITGKIAFQPVASSALRDLLADLPDTAQASRAVREVHGIQGTSLGGERPKMTVLHRAQHWIAKLRERGDAHDSPLREYLAMRAAQACGVHTARVEFLQAGLHPVLLVERFDRRVPAAGTVERSAYASAHTLLGLDSTATRGDAQRSYPYLAAELQRWCGAEGADTAGMQRELWRRMAFNALCGNGDDHPRNHGVRHCNGRWELAPAFDISPYPRFNGHLAMRVTRDGHSDAASWALLRDCQTFRYTEEEARAWLEAAPGQLVDAWERERAGLGVRQQDAPTPVPETWLNAPPPADLPPRRHPRVRRRR